MDEKKLTDEEIIKALDICSDWKQGDCEKCPLYEIDEAFKQGCDKVRARYIKDLINRQKAEIERLNKCVMSEEQVCKCCADIIQETRQQAVKDTAQNALEEFICRLVNARLVHTNDDMYYELLEAKDDLLKEKYGVEVE